MAGASGLSEGERSVLLLHPHWKTVLGPTLVLIAVVVAGVAAELLIPRGSYQGPARIGAAVVVIALAVAWFGIPFLRWQTTTYELTTRRLRLRRGILSRSGRDFPLIRISDVSFSHGLIDRMLGCGQLVVESAGEQGQLVLTEIPQVEKVQATLFQLVEDEHARLGQENREAPA